MQSNLETDDDDPKKELGLIRLSSEHDGPRTWRQSYSTIKSSQTLFPQQGEEEKADLFPFSGFPVAQISQGHPVSQSVSNHSSFPIVNHFKSTRTLSREKLRAFRHLCALPIDIICIRPPSSFASPCVWSRRGILSPGCFRVAPPDGGVEYTQLL